MSESDKILATFYGDKSFPIEWKSEDEKKLFWFFDDNHCSRPISPMYWSLNGWWGPSLEYMYRRFGFPCGKAWIGKRVNGYLYSAIIPREPESVALLGPYYGWIMPTYATNFLDWWQSRYLPEMQRNFEYIDNYDTQAASLRELMVFLEEAIDIQLRHLCIHWILNLAQFQASMDLQGAVKEVIGDVNPGLIGRILISIKDRNWDSLEALWKMKEQIKRDKNLNAVFTAQDRAADIIAQLEKEKVGQKFLETLDAYLKEFGVKPAMYTHEYINTLWVENRNPAVETLKGYLVSDYDFPAQHKKTIDDHRVAIQELRALIPAAASKEQREKLENAVQLAVRMMPLTPDHHFYIDQGTFARMRLVLLSVGCTMVKKGLLSDAEDILFLEYDQLRAYVSNPKTAENAGGYDGPMVIKQARQAYEQAQKVRPRDWIGTVTHWSMYEEPYHTLWGWPEKFEREQEKAVKGEVRGIGGSPGVVEGVARIVRSPEEFDSVQKGEILVCVMTNPAWIVVFSKVAAIVTDAGGVLSHTATVAREFMLPSVVGTGKATTEIKNGDILRVDGDNGVVTIL